MKYLIVKKIQIERETLEQALADHNNGTTVSMTADTVNVPERTPQPTTNSSIRNNPIPQLTRPNRGK